MLFTPKVDHAVDFEHGTGFGGERPEFHGHFENQVPLSPAFCALCVYDENLDVDVAMRQ
jgi:hypothetical protein